MKKKKIIKIIKEMLFDISKLNYCFTHEIAKEEPEPEETIDYIVNWKDAPEWALAHAYDETGEGFWYGPHAINYISAVRRFASYAASGWQIGDSVMEIHKKTWKNSITLRPLYF